MYPCFFANALWLGAVISRSGMQGPVANVASAFIGVSDQGVDEHGDMEGLAAAAGVETASAQRMLRGGMVTVAAGHSRTIVGP